ncbi:MAG: enoyl-CoA hydratase-related protein [Acidimicrobiales bacterium]|nr:enoyl-CoA hydratase-related protein [Acidimicrobiales bacterium]
MSETRQPFVTIDRGDPAIPVVTLNRPERRNALSMDLVSDGIDAFRELHRDREARVIVLTGAGDGFCAGADLKGGSPAPDSEGRGPVGSVYRAQEHIVDFMMAVHECDKPVVAAVHGAAVGGGLALALASDLRVADETAYFGSVFINVGLTSCDIGTSYFLPRLVGSGHAMDMMITGRHVAADEADRMGLLNRLVPTGTHVDEAKAYAAEIAKNNEYGVWLTKRGLWANIDAPSIRHAVELENRQQVLGTFTGNMTEAMRAFGERREPNWGPL